MYPLHPIREAVEKAIATQPLKEVASKATDPDIFLGLALLAQAGNPVRKELSELAAKAKAEYAHVAAVLPLLLDGVDEGSVSELIKRDLENALGHYLQGNLRYQSGHEREALEAFRKAGRCPELRLYDAITSNALFKTVDELNFKGEDRLCALSWMASRLQNFSSTALQPLNRSLLELATTADLATRHEISDLLLVLAGHLFATNFWNRWFGERALESAFSLKAEVAAAENSPTMFGYGAAGHVIFNAALSWPGFENVPKPQKLARSLPSRIHRAFAVVDPDQFNGRYVGELSENVPESDRAAFEQAKENAAKAARALLDLALTDPDGIIGAFLKGITSPRDGKRPWLLQGTLVGRLLHDRPELFRAAAANEEAMHALWQFSLKDPEHQNTVRMMEIGWALHSHASAHDDTFPDNLDVLFQEGHLKAPLEPKSLLTGKPYGYVAAGEKRPRKSLDASEMVLLYDDQVNEAGYVSCVLACCTGSCARLEDIQAQLGKRDANKRGSAKGF